MAEPKAKTHLEKLGFSDTDKKSSQHDIIQKWATDNIKTIVAETIMKNNPYPYEIINVRWEHQVMLINGNYRMIVGFIDLFIQIDGKFYFNNAKEYEYCTEDVFIEIKTAIPDLGSLIRQMRAYQAYRNNSRTEYLIISPDDRHVEYLNNQGFYFYKYQDPNLLF